MISEDEYQGFRRIVLRRDRLRVEVLPELGGKLRVLSLDDGPNLLLEPPEFPYARALSTTLFEDRDTSGFDECFPSVAAGPSPDGPQLPDHGELWRLPWRTEVRGEALVMEAETSAVPSLFRRTLSIRGATLQLSYELHARAKGPRRYLWSAHPLLAASAGSRVELPREVRELLVEWSSDPALARRGQMLPWPGPTSLDALSGRHWGTAFKLFTPRLSERSCAYHDARTGHSVRLAFDVPYLGVWICQGGWPTSRPAKHHTVALEPCTGRPDALAEAAARGEDRLLAPGEVHRWTVEVALSKR